MDRITGGAVVAPRHLEHTGGVQRQRGGVGQGEAPMVGPAVAAEGGLILRPQRHKGTVHVLAHLVGARGDRRAQPGGQRLTAGRQRCHRPAQDAAVQAAPAGVHRRHRAAVLARQQYRQAVGGKYHAGPARFAGPDPVGAGVGVAGLDDAVAVDLLQPGRRMVHRQHFVHMAAGLFHPRRVVTAVHAQVETVPRGRRVAPQTGGHQGANPGMGLPVGPQPLADVGQGHCASRSASRT